MGRWVILANVVILALSFALVKPEWAGRLTAVTLFLGLVTVALLIYGFHPNSEFLHHKSKIARCGSERTKRVARWIIRSLVIAGAVCLLAFGTVPITQDCVQVLVQGRPYLLEVRGRVHSDDFIFGLYFLHQDILVIKEGEQSGHGYGAFFFPRLARVGNTYQFLIAPRSRMVLDWQ
jgi:hypothetical protein